jgi:NAD(P)H-flavin reductase
MADRNDVRPVVLFYGNRDWDDVAFRDDLERLKDRLDLTLVHVLERTPPGWRGETGYVTADVLARHLPNGISASSSSSAGPIR